MVRPALKYAIQTFLLQKMEFPYYFAERSVGGDYREYLIKTIILPPNERSKKDSKEQDCARYVCCMQEQAFLFMVPLRLYLQHLATMLIRADFFEMIAHFQLAVCIEQEII